MHETPKLHINILLTTGLELHVGPRRLRGRSPSGGWLQQDQVKHLSTMEFMFMSCLLGVKRHLKKQEIHSPKHDELSIWLVNAVMKSLQT